MTDKTCLIAPSILSGDFAALGQSVKDAEKWGADWIHCDVMDGVYVKNMTFGMPMIKALRGVTELPLDVHLMITEPENYVEKFVDAGADIVTFHPEASQNPAGALQAIRAKGCRAGIALNPDIRFSDWKHLVPLCDMIVVMSVYAGLGGQKFIPETLDKVKELKTYLDENGCDIPVEIDGGVGEGNARVIRDAGVDVLVAGSAVYRSEDPEKTIRILRGM